jgi:hypothetical protein
MADCIHQYILDEVRDDLSQHLKKNYSPKYINQAVSDEIMLKYLFTNHRKKLDGSHIGLRLSHHGHVFLSNYFKFHVFNRDEHGRVSNKTLLDLEQKMNYPYFVDGNRVILYSDSDSTWFALQGGTLEEYLESL